MGDGTRKNPYTREDVERLIKENGDTAEGLRLSGRFFEDYINLSKLDLKGIWIIEAKLMRANFKGANLSNAHLERALLLNAILENTLLVEAHLENAALINASLEGAYLNNANLEGANLRGAYLKGARLVNTNLKGTDLRGAELIGVHLHRASFSFDTEFEQVNWGKYTVGEEELVDKAKHTKEQKVWLGLTEGIYRRLKTWHTQHGLYDMAGKFFYREMTAKRKALRWLHNPFPKIRETLYWLLCGYGERPWQAFGSAVIIVLVAALIYFAIGTLTPNTFPHSLYYSMVSFTALGYGSWAPEPMGWVKWLGACEAFVGVFIMALFLITFTRKMIR